MSHTDKNDYVQLREISPLQYEFTIQHSVKAKPPILFVHQFMSATAAEFAARHYNTLLEKAFALGFTLEGYYLYGPNGQVLPISDVFDLDMSIRYVEQHLSAVLETIDSNPDIDPFSSFQSMS